MPERRLEGGKGRRPPLRPVRLLVGRSRPCRVRPLVVEEDSDDPSRFSTTSPPSRPRCPAPRAVDGWATWATPSGASSSVCLRRHCAQSRSRGPSWPSTTTSSHATQAVGGGSRLCGPRSRRSAWSGVSPSGVAAPVPARRSRASFALGAFALRPGRESHLESVARAVEHIHSGRRAPGQCLHTPRGRVLRRSGRALCAGAERLEPLYGAFLSHRSVAVASFSPELFLRRRGERVLASP